jgi:hypothetical protein
MKAVLRFDAEEMPLGEWSFEVLHANQNQSGPIARAQLPSGCEGRFELLLRVAEHPDWNSSYTLLWRRYAVA